MISALFRQARRYVTIKVALAALLTTLSPCISPALEPAPAPSGVPVNLDVQPPPGAAGAIPNAPPAAAPAARTAGAQTPPPAAGVAAPPAAAIASTSPVNKNKKENISARTEYPEIGAKWVPFPVPKPKFNLDTAGFLGDARIAVRRPLPEGTLPRPLDREARDALSRLEPGVKQFGGASPARRNPCQASLSAAPGLPAPTEQELELSNNLRRRTGVYQSAAGQYIEISGVVRGEDCLPVTGAEVTLWQRDSAGLSIADYKGSLENPKLHPDFDRYFAYSGRAFTDNAGRFSFISVLPGTKRKDEPPYVNVAIKAVHYETLVSRIYLLPNKEEEGSLAYVPPSNPFVNTDIPPLVELKGLLSTSEIIRPEPGRFGVRFYTEIALEGSDPNRKY